MENLTLPLSCRGQESLEQSEPVASESAEADNVQQTELSSEYLKNDYTVLECLPVSDSSKRNYTTSFVIL